MKVWIPIEECQDRHVYRILSRNLLVGVYSEATKGFLGIRTKFNNRYVFEEYHRDTGSPYGTVAPQEDLGIVCPEDILLKETLSGSWDSVTGREVDFDKPVGEGGRGWFFVDTNEPDQSIMAYVKANEELFTFLEQIGKVSP